MLVDEFENTCRALWRSFFVAVLELAVKTILNDAAFIVDDINRSCDDAKSDPEKLYLVKQIIFDHLENMFMYYLSRDLDGLSVNTSDCAHLCFSIQQVGRFYSWALVCALTPDFLYLAQNCRFPFLSSFYRDSVRGYKLPSEMDCYFNGYEKPWEDEEKLFERNYKDNAVAIEHAVNYIRSALLGSSVAVAAD